MLFSFSGVCVFFDVLLSFSLMLSCIHEATLAYSSEPSVE